MCGIAGYILNNAVGCSSTKVNILLQSIRSRGPDDEGICLIDRERRRSQTFKTDLTVPRVAAHLPHINDEELISHHNVSFIHTRYSVIDLTEAAHQPFISQDSSLVGVFNGEIYNYIELRDELRALGVKFRTSSDTEVLIEGYCVWGEDLWPKMNGFWAVALFNIKNNSIVFSRDRIGVAPLYYRETQDGFFFASAIQSLIDIDPGGIDLNNDAILGFAQTGIKDHDNKTFYAQIKSLPSSSTVIFQEGHYTIAEAALKKYWEFPNRRLGSNDISFREAVEKYREIFFNAVELRLRADVKIAFELSGGLDSSSVVAAAAMLRDNDITTYTAKVEGADEEPFARSILQKYPVDYRVIENFEKDFIDEYDSFSKIMEEPYDNPNAYTHHKMLKKMKAEGVSVVVTGAGGDEILAGYESSFWPKAYSELKKNGYFLHADIYEFLRRYKTIKSSFRTLKHYFIDLPKFIRRLILPQKLVAKQRNQTSALAHRESYGKLSFHEQTLYHFKVGLVPFYMRSSDHFTMEIPIEHRFPFLDYRMIELCMQMPIIYLMKNGWTKYLLRKAMEPYLPKKIIWRRKKMGFTFPYGPYFSAYRSDFEPLMHYLRLIDFPIDYFGTYDQLLPDQAPLLWRLLSIAIWAKNQNEVLGLQ
ncbi:MAG: asparagine synthase (glutamine-hydrolyzing) [Desulfobacterales bacterium]|uniref:asparagine synthase (glutamine-hydrolyzing) n=1 Tax=Candidatus Desulfatibia vada TaxID=2841696 RepID=A0A8J6P213_9BACT|nr:asparagine synthase (glutamine-hydrolyzing) [Candidatus Desulfatibia vada]